MGSKNFIKRQMTRKKSRYAVSTLDLFRNFDFPFGHYIACALAHTACLKGSTTKYYRISRLLMELNQSKADGTYTRKLKSLARINMLILDDWGLEPLKGTQRNDLMEIMDDRHGSSSTVIISQLPTEEWYQSIGDNTLADAILDRLMHNAHRIKLKGESMRKKLSDVDVI